MKDETLFNLSYGMYAIGVKNDKKVSACIVNTVFSSDEYAESNCPQHEPRQL